MTNHCLVRSFDVKMPPGVLICTVKKSGDTVDMKSGSKKEEEVKPLLHGCLGRLPVPLQDTRQ